MWREVNWPEGAAAGEVVEIQHFSLHDGPGIRSTVFLKGCPLRCLWCHNPEGQSFRETVMMNATRCARCGACQRVCPQGCHRIADGEHSFQSEACIYCGACVEHCPARALRRVGRRMSVQDVLNEVLRDRDYFRESGGGITLSGGEPSCQPAFAWALLRAAGEAGLHRVLETSGCASRSVLEHLAGEAELILFDCKETDPQRHRKLVGTELAPILENLCALHDAGAKILLRCPIVPGCNDRSEHIRALGRLCLSLPNLEGIELLPYHSLGVSKAARLGIEQRAFAVPAAEHMQAYSAMLRDMGLRVVPEARGEDGGVRQ